MENSGLVIEWLILILILVAIGIIYFYMRKFKSTKSDQNHYLEALEAVVDGEYRLAIQKFKEAARQDSNNIFAYLRLGDLLREQGMVNNALKLHKELTFRSNLSPEISRKIKYSILLDYEALGDFDHAISAAKELLESPTNGKIKATALKLISFLEKKQLWEEALKYSQKYFNSSNKHFQRRNALYHVFIGLELMKEDIGKDARIKFKEALKIDPDCSAAYYYLGISYYNEERLEDAITEWKKLCDKIPSKAYLVFPYLEKAWFELGRFTEAENLYLSILSQDPNNTEAALALLEIYNKKGDYERTLDLLSQMTDNPDDRFRVYEIQALFNKGQYKSAASKAMDFFEEKYPIGQLKFVCQECQYTTNEPAWICPQCKSIDSFNI